MSQPKCCYWFIDVKSYTYQEYQHFLLKPSVHQLSSIWTLAELPLNLNLTISHSIYAEWNNSVCAVDGGGHEGAASPRHPLLMKIVLLCCSLYNFCFHPSSAARSCLCALSPKSRNNDARLISRRYKCQVEHFWKSMKYQILSLHTEHGEHGGR